MASSVGAVEPHAAPLGKEPGVEIHESKASPSPTDDREQNQAQLQPHLNQPPNTTTSHLLVSSPYTTPDHLLDLSTLNTANRILALALTILAPIRTDYATAPYLESFNWPAVFAKVHELARAEEHRWTRQSFYVVAFRSILRADANGDRLHLLDERSHAEAVQSGGLLKYWFGVKNERRENLATCVWRSREDARAGGTGPWHAQARGAARELYEKIEFTTLELVIGEDVGDWEFKAWRD
ncbi:uncharacterized protein BJX67DRAFT_376930 [Aspergillus lucknowensis]|uniref:Uncharacterized protein n=1 Tax=Aspergillus lucknowensis TaxID=176173 RepID=A0ABR4M658_9EURO